MNLAYVVTDSCVKDHLCVDVCSTDCIHPKTDEPKAEEVMPLNVDPAGCIDRGACAPASTPDSIFVAEDLPEDKKQFLEKNAACPATILVAGSYSTTPGARVSIGPNPP
jgi:NAD-dependent dihydropyrimidine dehydrogenase PreA subunit